MLGRSFPSGSDAISFHNTLFRVSELCWIKAVRLSIPELVVRIAAAISAVAWVFVMKGAKQDFYNLECLLGIFPLVLAWNIAGSLKIGCSGDFEESYEERRGARSNLFRGWIDTLKMKEPDWVHLQGSSYDLLLNPHRIAWIRPCYQWQIFPLIVAAVFTGYYYVLSLNLQIPSLPVIDDFMVLSFRGSTGTLKFLIFVIISLALVAFGVSIKRSVEICGTGGVQDTFPMTAADQGRLVEMVVGRSVSRVTTAASQKPVGSSSTKGAKANSMEVAIAPSTPPAQVKMEKADSESAKPEVVPAKDPEAKS